MDVDPLLDVECSIAGISRCFGLTARAIRHYEDQGLVSVSRDRLNRRRYGREARDRLQLIARLRMIGLGIKEIRALLAAGASPPDRRRSQIIDAVAARMARLQAESEQARSLLADLQTRRFGALHPVPSRLADIA